MCACAGVSVSSHVCLMDILKTANRHWQWLLRVPRLGKPLQINFMHASACIYHMVEHMLCLWVCVCVCKQLWRLKLFGGVCGLEAKKSRSQQSRFFAISTPLFPAKVLESG